MKRTIPLILLLFGLVACDLINPPIDPPTNPSKERPSVISTKPSNGDNVVSPDVEIEARLELPNGDIDDGTLGNGTVRLTEVGSDALLSGDISFSGDMIIFEPRNSLDVEKSYTFEITDGVKDESGMAVEPYTITFTTSNRPRIQYAEPGNRDTDVNPEASVSLYPINTNGGLDNTTNTAENVKLIEVSTGTEVDVRRGTSGGFDIITLDPRESLQENTEYRVEVTDGVKDQSGNSFIPFESTFTTREKDASTPGNVRFDRQKVVSDNDSYTSLAIGPDRKLYATTVDGRIKRFPINADGTLGNAETITSLQGKEGGPRLLIGFAFDPSSTADNLIAWVSHTYVDDNFTLKNIDEPWSGKITRLSGPNLETVQDYVEGLPRSSKDHVTNSIAFNPNEPGVLYFNQGSNSAMGAPDGAWDYQEERLLSAATLRLDIGAVEVGTLPLNVQTEDGGSYDPFATGAPLTVFGSGIRNAYDLVWHSNGSLYVPTNGSNLGGIVPRYDLSGLDSGVCDGYNGPKLDDPSDVDGKYVDDRTDGWLVEDQVQSDFLFRVEEGGYYGHPNPKRCEWILNGGGNYEDEEARVNIYKSDTDPDPNYRGFAYDFERNKSPNGVIEYKSNTFGGSLQGKLLVARYSNEDDILVLTPGGSNGDISQVETPDDLDDLSDPIDLVEDTTNGNLYISEFDESKGTDDQGIVLLTPSN